MRSYTIEGIIIKRRNIGEADRILTVMTKDHGKIQVNAKGVRKITSRRSSHVELLNVVQMALHKGRKLPVLTEVVTIEHFSRLKSNLKQVSFAYHICELIDGLCPENQENKQIYFLLKDLLAKFSQKNVMEEIYHFEVQLLEVLGYWPEDMTISAYQISPFIESILERKLKARQIIPRLL